MYDRLRYRPVVAVAAVGGPRPRRRGLLKQPGISSDGAGARRVSGKVTISIDCAPPAAQQPVQHKEWLEDVALFEKANPNITINSVYNYPCEQTRARSPRCCAAGPSRTSSTPTSPTCRRCCSPARRRTSPST